MKKILSRFLLIIFVITISIAGISCSKYPANSKTQVSNNSQKITLKLAWWGNDTRKELTEKAIALFQQKHPNVEFEIKNYVDPTEIRNNLAMDTSDEDMPDIIQMNFDYFYDYAQRDLLEPLDEYVGQNVLNTSNIDQSSLEGGRYNNQLYGIPLGINSYCIAVNPDVFKKAGIDIPKSGYTYDDLYKVAKQLKEKVNDPSFYPLANFLDFGTFVRSMGGTYYNSSGTGLGYENDQVFVDYYNIQKKWLAEGLIAPAPLPEAMTSSTLTAYRNAFISSGKSAFWYGVSNSVGALNKSQNNVMQIISIPSPTPGKITSYIRPSMFFSVSAYSKHKEEAVEFVDFITNDLEVNDILKGERGVPASAKVSESVKQKLNEANKQQYLFMDFLKEHPSPVDTPTPNAAGNVNSLLTRLSEKILNGSITPEDAAKQFSAGTEKILSGVKGE